MYTLQLNVFRYAYIYLYGQFKQNFCFYLRQTFVLTEKFDASFCMSSLTKKSFRREAKQNVRQLSSFYALQQSPFFKSKALIVAYTLFSALGCFSMNCHAKRKIVCEWAFRLQCCFNEFSVPIVHTYIQTYIAVQLHLCYESCTGTRHLQGYIYI